MKSKSLFHSGLLAGLALILMLGSSSAPGIAAPGIQGAQDGPDQPDVGVGNNFSYQGRLVRGGSPANGEYDFRFILYDALSGGSQVGTTEFKDDVNVRNGMFTVVLNFGDVFNGELLFLEVAVRPGDSTGLYITLSPRHATWAKPYAIFSTDSARLGDFPASDYQKRVSGTCDAGSAMRTINANGTVACETFAGSFWSLEGNSGTDSTNFLGTTDNTPLVLKADGDVGWRLEPNPSETPNILGGHADNAMVSGVFGGVIAGGGAEGVSMNFITDSFSVIGGGDHNTAGNGTGTISDALYATVGGGHMNQALDGSTTIGGGFGNVVQESSGTIGGGSFNHVTGDNGTVPGGYLAAATHNGELAYANGGFDNSSGTAQTSTYVMRNSTSNDTSTMLYLDGVDDLITIAADRAVVFDILVIGHSEAGETAGYEMHGLIANDNGTTLLVGSTIHTVIGEDDASWHAFLSASNVTDSFTVSVNGDATDTVYWVATVRTVEVALP